MRYNQVKITALAASVPAGKLAHSWMSQQIPEVPSKQVGRHGRWEGLGDTQMWRVECNQGEGGAGRQWWRDRYIEKQVQLQWCLPNRNHHESMWICTSDIKLTHSAAGIYPRPRARGKFTQGDLQQPKLPYKAINNTIRYIATVMSRINSNNEISE